MKIKYEDYLTKTSLSKEELLAHAWGNLILDPPAEGCGMLPAPPMLMFDRVVEITREGNKGKIVAEQDIHLDAWFFQCHFRKDPVQPGCLGVDAVWQLLGLYATLRGGKGYGRALGTESIEFFGQIRPHNKLVRYDIDIRRCMITREHSMVVGSATVLVDGEPVYSIKNAKSGLFYGIQYDDYPYLSPQAIGGQMGRAS